MSVVARFLATLKRLGAATAGVAMIEFVFLLPVMVLMFFATVEVSNTIIAKRKLNLATYTLADLTTRVQTVSSSDVTAIFGSVASVMAPLNLTSLRMRISSVIVYPNGTTCVDWSRASGTGITALTPGATVTLPPVLTQGSTTDTRDFILAETVLPYDAGTHGFIPGLITLHEGPTYMVPRVSLRVTADSSIQASSPCS